ncbi:hypothetical protein BDR26DRAFT_872658 [Obelidium mucronatum]|nr:hypothetical protein BDR26DRAFT_872658 [Obelidium mucronatum]
MLHHAHAHANAHDKENTPAKALLLKPAAKLQQPLANTTAAKPLLNQRVAALIDITNATPLPKPKSAKPLKSRLDATPKPSIGTGTGAGTGTGTGRPRGSAGATGTRRSGKPATAKLVVHVDQGTHHVHETSSVEPIEKDDVIPDIEYAPLDPVIPLGFEFDHIDLTGLGTPQWSDVFITKSLDEISDYSMEPEHFEFDVGGNFDIELDLSHDPLSSLDPVEPFLF